MIALHDLPAINATLNATAAVLLVWGYTLIRRKRVQQHRRVMVSAFAVSVVFLICYVIYHAQVGSVPYPKTKPFRTAYLTLLFTHVILAATVPVLASITLYRAWKADFARHRRIARWTFPIWLYVSVTGVIVYWMLYRF